MTEKRFFINRNMVIDRENIIPSTMWQFEEQQKKYCDELNNLHEENEQLKDEVYDEMDDALAVLVELYEYVPFDSRKKMNRLYNRLKSLRDDMND